MRRTTGHRKTRRVLGTMCVLALVAGSATSAAEQAQPAQAVEPNLELLQVAETIFLGIIPRTSSIADTLEDFKIVVDLRYPYEGVYDEVGGLKRRGIDHINIPTSSHGPDLQAVIALETEIANHPATKILIHDSNGHRSAMMWAAHLLHSGDDFEQALAAVAAFYDPAELRPRLERFRTYQLPLARVNDDEPGR